MHTFLALRPKQWIKNAFVFAALVFSRKLTDSDAILHSLWCFAAFCATCSSIYLVNDVADYERDRHHPKKCKRPIASGKVSRPFALTMSGCLVILGLTAAWSLNFATGMALSIYFVMNLGYTFKLKNTVLLDVFIIAIGFLLRVISGAFAIKVGVSPWLLICTLFIALFLAFCKRRHELESLGNNASEHRANLSAYSIGFIDKIISALTAMTTMSYALYTIDPGVVKHLGTDGLIITVPIVLLGIFRYLYLVHQKHQGGSPTELVLTDRSLQGVIALYMVVAILLIYFNVQLGLSINTH